MSLRRCAAVALGCLFGITTTSALGQPATPAPADAATATLSDCVQAADRVKAVAACSTLIQQAGKDAAKLAPLYSARAAHHQASGRPRDALEDLSRALAADPQNADLWTKRGDVRAGLGQRIRAAADYAVALKYEPRSVPALLGRGEQFRLLGALKRSVEDLTSALALEPRSSGALAARAYAHERLGKTADALADAEAALKIDPDATLAILARGLARRSTDKAAAVIDLKRVLQLDPKSPVAAAALKKLGS